MNKDFILRKMREQRQFKVQLDEKLSVVLERPTRLKIASIQTLSDLFGSYGEKIHEYAVGWGGFTEEVLMGPAGGSDLVDFDVELFQEFLRDKPDFVVSLLKAIGEETIKIGKQDEELEKN